MNGRNLEINRDTDTGADRQTDDNRPLVSFILLTYNQEQFVRESVEGALAQTYTPLEIIISDDCSKDSTFKIIKETVANYKGKHKIILNRNNHNLGIGGNINSCMKLSCGEFIVGAAGDDISLPQRTSALVKAWESSNREYKSIYSDIFIIDEQGNIIGERSKEYAKNPAEAINRQDFVLGCSHAWDRSIFDVFGALREDLMYEDVVLPFRSLLLGSVHRLDQKMVLYRKCESLWKKAKKNSVKKTWRNRIEHNLKLHIIALNQIRKDIKVLKPNEQIYYLRCINQKEDELNNHLILINKNHLKFIKKILNERRLQSYDSYIVAIKKYIKNLRVNILN